MDKVLKISVMLAAVDRMSAVIKSATDSSVKSLTRVSKEADKLSKSAFDFGRQAGTFGLAMAAPLGLAVNAAAKYEQMNVSLKTAFQGNEEAAKSAFKVIDEFATKTPYQMEEVMTGFIKLKNMGLDPSIEALTAYGNTASSMGKSLNDMIEAVADAATGEFERLKEFGIRSKSEGDNVSFTFQGITTTVGKNAAEIENYLKQIGLTKFAGGMEAQSQTFNGKLSTMRDNVTKLAVKIGDALIPVLSQIMEKIAPVIEQITEWIKRNPELTQKIVLAVAAVAALSLAASALAFVFGGLMKIVSAVSGTITFMTRVVGFANKGVGYMTRAVRFLWTTTAGLRGVIIRTITSLFSWGTVSKIQTGLQYGLNLAMKIGTTVSGALNTAFKWLGGTIKWLTRVMMANPILAIIGLIAMAVYWIYENWDGIVSYFKNLWQNTSMIFRLGWARMKEIVMAPIQHIKVAWEKLKGFFSGLWASVKKPFVDFYNYITSLGSKFMEAGANIVNSIWNGMKSSWDKMMKWFSDGLKKMREYLPFSPAKRGPLMDIHRVKIVETIAGNIKGGPLVKAMEGATKQVRRAIPKATGLESAFPAGTGGMQLGGAGGGGIVVNFNPSITLTGTAGAGAQDDFISALRKYQPELMRVIEDAIQRRERTKY